MIGGLKAHVPMIWRHLSTADRRRFVVHLRRFWSVAGSLLTSAENDVVNAAIAAGQINFLHGVFDGTECQGSLIRVRVRPHRQSRVLCLDASLVLNFDEAPPDRKASRHRSFQR